MSIYRVSSAYAKSLLELAVEAKKVDAVNEDVKFIFSTLEGSVELRSVLSSPVILNAKKLSILEQVFKGKVSEITFSFFSLIAKKNREAYLYHIAKEFIAEYKTLNGIQSGTVVTAIAADEVIKKQINTLVKSITKNKTDLEYKVDPSVLGGFILTIGDRQIDKSVSSQLNSLKNQFSNNPYIPKY